MPHMPSAFVGFTEHQSMLIRELGRIAEFHETLRGEPYLAATSNGYLRAILAGQRANQFDVIDWVKLEKWVRDHS